MLDISIYDFTLEEIRFVLNNFSLISFFITVGFFITLYTCSYMIVMGIKCLINIVKKKEAKK